MRAFGGDLVGEDGKDIMVKEDQDIIWHFLDHILPLISENWDPMNKSQSLVENTTLEEFAYGVYLIEKNVLPIKSRKSRNGKRKREDETKRIVKGTKQSLLEDSYNKPNKLFREAMQDCTGGFAAFSKKAREHFSDVHSFSLEDGSTAASSAPGDSTKTGSKPAQPQVSAVVIGFRIQSTYFYTGKSNSLCSSVCLMSSVSLLVDQSSLLTLKFLFLIVWSVNGVDAAVSSIERWCGWWISCGC